MDPKQTQPYRLDDLSKLATEIGIEWRRVDENHLDVVVSPGVVLAFYNMVEQNDTLVGFLDSQWHAHGILHFVAKDNMWITCDELDLLVGLASGDLLIVTRYLHGQFDDRWLAHKDQPLDLRYILSGEELRVSRIALLDAERADREEGSSATKTA